MAPLYHEGRLHGFEMASLTDQPEYQSLVRFRSSERSIGGTRIGLLQSLSPESVSSSFHIIIADSPSVASRSMDMDLIFGPRELEGPSDKSLVRVQALILNVFTFD